MKNWGRYGKRLFSITESNLFLFEVFYLTCGSDEKMEAMRVKNEKTGERWD